MVSTFRSGFLLATCAPPLVAVVGAAGLWIAAQFGVGPFFSATAGLERDGTYVVTTPVYATAVVAEAAHGMEVGATCHVAMGGRAKILGGDLANGVLVQVTDPGRVPIIGDCPATKVFVDASEAADWLKPEAVDARKERRSTSIATSAAGILKASR